MGRSATWRRFGKVPLGIALALAFMALLLFGPHMLISAVALVAVGMAGYEVGGLLGLARAGRVGLVSAVVAGALVSQVVTGGSRAAVNEFMFLALLAWLVVAPLCLMRPLPPSRKGVAMVWGFFLVAAWLAVVVLAEYDRWLLITGLGAVWLTDVVAWYAGSQFGRKRLAAVISPNKSWEGVFAAFIAVATLVFLLGRSGSHGNHAAWLLLLVASAITGLAVLGDLFESTLKRAAGCKDSSGLLGSHGGILDRIDSWLPTLPFLALLSVLER